MTENNSYPKVIHGFAKSSILLISSLLFIKITVCITFPARGIRKVRFACTSVMYMQYIVNIFLDANYANMTPIYANDYANMSVGWLGHSPGVCSRVSSWSNATLFKCWK